MRKDIDGVKPNFVNSFGMGYEGFSRPWKMPKMHQSMGNRGEFLFLALFVPAIMLLKKSRTKNEDGVRSALGFSNNRYAHFATVSP